MGAFDTNIDVLERMERAVEKVRDRLLRVARALEDAGVRYALIGGNAVAAWVATVDEAAVRNTRDVDILLERDDFARAREALEAPAPGTGEAERLPEGPRVLALDALVRMKLTSFRRKDQIHLLDLIEVGLIDAWDLPKLPPALASRLQELLDNPDS